MEILPQPMDATLIKLLGAFLPNTLAGTIVGKWKAMAAPKEALPALLRNFLRLDLFDLFIGLVMI